MKYICLIVFFISSSATLFAVDLRQYQHGVNVLTRSDGKYIIIWSSSGNPPTGENENGNWTHDIYYSIVDGDNPAISEIQTLIAYPEAQEPASAAMADNGNIIITMEDGWDSGSVAQRYGVYTDSLTPIRSYPNLVFEGGHSGHATAVGNYFVVFYNEGWIDGGGVNDLGTGIDVYAKVYNSQGVFFRFHQFDVDSTTREGWPLPAGSKDHVCFLWQQGYDDTDYSDIFIEIYNPVTDEIIKEKFKLEGGLKYYTHDVQYIKVLDAFLVTGSYQSGGGFAILLDNQGDILVRNNSLPSFVRESQAVVYNKNSEALIVRPAEASGLLIFSVNDSSITLNKKIETGYLWQYMGTDGVFLNSDSVYLVSMNKKGLVEKIISGIDQSTGINMKKNSDIGPQGIKLYPNFPNPFNSSTVIEYEIDYKQTIVLSVYDLLGQKIDELDSGYKNSGLHSIKWEAGSMASGIYFIQLHLQSGVLKRKILLLK